MGKRGSELIQFIQKEKKNLVSNCFANAHYGGWQSHLKLVI
jgi:hypothetical protein